MATAYKQDDVLFREGDASDFVYRLLAGQAQVTKALVAGGGAIGTIGPGDFVGEIGALVGCPRNASVRFTADSTLERFSRADFLHLIASDAVQSMRLLHALSLRTRVLVEQMSHTGAVDDFVNAKAASFWTRLRQLVVGVGRAGIDAVRRYVKFVPREFGHAPTRGRPGGPALAQQTLRRGDHLFEEGAPSANVFLIRSGVVEVTRLAKPGPRRIGRLTAGEFVGEMGVLEARPRSATATAATTVVVDVVPPAEFHRMMQRSRAVYFKVIDSLCERNQRLSRLIQAWHSHTAPGAASALYDTMSSMESVAQLAEQRLLHDVISIKRFFHHQVEHGRDMVTVYQRYLRGEATKDEMERANAHFRDYIRIAGLGTLLILPGAVLTIPLAVKLGKVLGVEVLPADDADDEPDETGGPGEAPLDAAG